MRIHRFFAVTVVVLAGCNIRFDAQSYDGGGPSDGGGASSDMAAQPAADGFGPGTITLTNPAPLSSLVPTDTTFDFDVQLGDAPDTLEPTISVSPRGGAPLAGAFSWKPSGAGYKLTFIPSAPLTDQTDFLISVANPNEPTATLLSTGVSTGSHPRVTGVSLHNTGGSAGVWLDVTFSEPMMDASVLAAIGVSAAQQAVAGHAGPDGLGGYRFDVDAGQALTAPIALRIAAGSTGAKAATGTALDPADWDQSTVASDGSFQVSFTGVDLSSTAPIDVTWTPTVD